MNKIILAAAVILSLAACKTEKNVPADTVVVKVDTTVVDSAAVLSTKDSIKADKKAKHGK